MTEEIDYLKDFKKFCKANTKKESFLEELDWYALSVGWFLAKGATLEEANTLACKARYDYGYWVKR